MKRTKWFAATLALAMSLLLATHALGMEWPHAWWQIVGVWTCLVIWGDLRAAVERRWGSQA